MQDLGRRLRQLEMLQSLLAEAVPANLAAATSVAIAESGELLLFSDNGAVAAKLRQMAPRILAFFRQRGIEATGIRLQVQVSIRHNPLPQKQIFMGQRAGEALLELAGRLEESPLKRALVRLGHRADPASDHDDEPLEGVQSHKNQ